MRFVTSIEVVVDKHAAIGECPVWDTRAHVLWWVDIGGRAIHRYDPAFGADAVKVLPGRPGSFALTQQFGLLLVAMENRLVWYEWDTGVLTDFRELEPPDTGNRMNDGRCDPAGRFWVGSMFDPTSAGEFTGRLHRIEADGSFTTTRRGVGVSNGLGFSPDGTTMYFADTPHRTVWAYDYDIATGEAGDERVFFEFGDLMGKPDGAAVDEDGCYWVACVRGAAIARITPAGDLDRVIEMPVTMPTMPAFGGEDLDVLYVTSLGGPGSNPLDGALFAVEVGVRGREEPRFAGLPA